MKIQSFEYNGTIINRRSDGYVNLTQMCQANGKQSGDFLRLKAAKEYLDALSVETGIPVTQLYQVFQGGIGEQGTWGHPMLALRLAQWISPGFAVWCDAHLFSLMETGSTRLAEVNPDPEDKSHLVPIACNALDLIFANVQIKPELLAGLKLNATQELVPSMAKSLESSRQLLINNTAQKHELLTPTDIGKKLGLSAIAVNKKLVELGLQEKSDRKSKKEPAYRATEKGLEYSDLTLASGTGSDNSTFQQLRWYSQVVELIEETLTTTTVTAIAA